MKNSISISFVLLFAAAMLFPQNSHAASWKTKVVASAPTSTRPVICSDSLGHLHIAWTSDDIYGQILRYATNQSGQWVQRRVAGSASDEAYVPVITADKYGFAYISARFASSWFRIKYATNNEITLDSWNVVTQMLDAHYHETSIEVDSDRNTHVFAQEDTWGSNVFYQNHDLNDVVIDGGTSQFYATAIDQNDVLYFVGSHADGIWYTNNSSGSWSGADSIDQVDVSAYHPSITCDNDGVLHVVFASADGIYYLNNKSGSWGTPELTGATGIFPNVVVDENGCAHIAYYTEVENGALCYLNNIGGSWSTSETITVINTDASPATEDVAHVESKIALDLKNSTVNIVYIQDGDSVTVAQTSDYELRSPKSTDISSTLISNAADPITDTLSTGTQGTLTLLQFTVSDIAGDGLPTKIREMVIQRGAGTSEQKYFNDFFQNMTMEVSDGSNTACLLYGYKVIAGTAGSVWKSIPEGGALSFTLKGTLNDPLADVVDESVQFKINGLYDVIIDTTGSHFAYNCEDVLSDTLLFKLMDFDGSGTEADPFLINELDDLRILSENQDYWNKHFRQTADIDASATSGWNGGNGFKPIGGAGTYTSFSGSYNGNNHIINGLTIDRNSTDNIGLFGNIGSAAIENLGVTNMNITGNGNTGGLVGSGYYSTIKNCYTSGSVTGGYFVGGLTGYNNGTISNSTSSANVEGSVGMTGGFVGDNSGGTISNSYSTGDVTRNGGASTEYGGFCGRNDGGTIEDSYSTGSVFSSPGTAWNEGGNADKGFVGKEFGTPIYSNNFFDMEASNQSSDAVGAATGKTTAEMKNVDTFTDTNTDGLTTAWDFVTNPNDDAADNDYWDIDYTTSMNDGYPYLSWQDGSSKSLPIELASFSARCQGASIILQWVTASEMNNLGFILERATENANWIQIASYKTYEALKGQGTVSYRTDYIFTDHNVEAGKTYFYRLADVNSQGKVTVHAPLSIKMDNLPVTTKMENAYPNPFNPQTYIEYHLAQDTEVSITVFDLLGRSVKTLFKGNQLAGSYHVYWNGRNKNGVNVPTGNYIIRLQTANTTQIQKVMLLK